MEFTLEAFNQFDNPQARDLLQQCCGSTKWIEEMLNVRPFKSKSSMIQWADDIWNSLSEHDWLEAFQHHPQIGDLESLRSKFASTQHLAISEQIGTTQASDAVLEQLAFYNQEYLHKFGYIFIICATGKSAQEMLEALKARINNDTSEELTIAAEEQRQITSLRLNKLIP